MYLNDKFYLVCVSSSTTVKRYSETLKKTNHATETQRYSMQSINMSCIPFSNEDDKREGSQYLLHKYPPCTSDWTFWTRPGQEAKPRRQAKTSSHAMRPGFLLHHAYNRDWWVEQTCMLLPELLHTIRLI